MAALTIAKNTIGWNRANVLFSTLETVFGEPLSDLKLIDGAPDLRLTHENPFKVEAAIDNTTTVSDGAVSVTADSKAHITAEISNDASGSVTALFDGAAAAYGALVSGNKVSSSAEARISGGSVTAASVSVNGKDDASITATSHLGTSAQLDNTNGANIADKLAGKLLDSYDYTNKSGTRTLKFGDKVRVATGSGDDEVVSIYQYMGATGALASLNVNLASAITMISAIGRSSTPTRCSSRRSSRPHCSRPACPRPG